ncbi:MAG: heavy-metal-associated domain-containing protein [Chitinophagales bacterium]|nr:heavy-metal-associated domain-containing protein [Chitinophagales bacterium]HMV14295.1 hypothetical protein [Chitinophagales bacterium]HMW11853.1 hypothetical protein [Chitinophagales bacterium]HMX59018.1 hypothetical protein [Chitinophagales bacterium]HMZ32949.1 hypothetical protein [Chitinophagales bacterium]
MKQNFLTLLITISLLLNVQYSIAQSTVTSASIKTNIYCDHCLECPTCGILLLNKLKQIKGIRQVNINTTLKLIKVSYEPSVIKINSIREHIAALGYDADAIKASISAYNSLDACCKK